MRWPLWRPTETVEDPLPVRYPRTITPRTRWNSGLMTDVRHEDREFRPATGWVQDQLDTIARTGDTGSVDIQGLPVVVLTILGAKSGLWRRVPLMRVEQDGMFAVVASAGGAPKHPVWFHNLTANPDIEIQDGTETTEVRARLLSGPERARWWDICVAAFPPYAEYQVKTDREIPVLLLEPTAA